MRGGLPEGDPGAALPPLIRHGWAAAARCGRRAQAGRGHPPRPPHFIRVRHTAASSSTGSCAHGSLPHGDPATCVGHTSDPQKWIRSRHSGLTLVCRVSQPHGASGFGQARGASRLNVHGPSLRTEASSGPDTVPTWTWLPLPASGPGHGVAFWPRKKGVGRASGGSWAQGPALKPSSGPGETLTPPSRRPGFCRRGSGQGLHRPLGGGSEGLPGWSGAEGPLGPCPSQHLISPATA